MEHFQLSLSGLSAIAQRSGGELSQFLAKQVWTPQDRESILTTLAQLLLDKEYTLLIGRKLRPLLLDLLERNAECIKAGGQVNHDLHERLCVAMSRLAASHSVVLPFALRYFQSAPPVFNRLFLESCDSSTVRYGRRRMKLRDLMEAAYRFLHQDELSFRETWDWSVCVPLLKSHDLAVRWYTSHCLALVTCMSDENRQTFLKKLFGTDELINFKLQLLDELHSQNVEQGLLLTNPENSLWHKDGSQQYTQGHIVSGDLCSNVVPICGITLPRKLQEMNSNQLVLVETTCRSLQSLAHAVSYQNAVLLEGPIGCGKTALVEHLARVTGRLKAPDLLKVQLGDQTDSKMLLGMYRCTDIPGEFVWQPGTLTQAVASGYWILLEDIDYAPLDVISVLISVLENGQLVIPGRGDCIKVSPGFQLFATRRLHTSSSGSWYRPQNSHASLLDKYWTKIHLDNMNRSELKEVLQQLYPNLDLALDRLLDIYIQLTGDKHHTVPIDSTEAENMPATEGLKIFDKRPSLEGRGLSLRDLLKWSNRIAYNFDGSSSSTAVNIFHEALDCFTAMLSAPAARLKMAEVIGSKLNISKQKAEFFCELYKPEITVRELDVSVGRVEMLRRQSESIRVHREKINFAATRPSSILIEQIAVCVNKAEPVLLVGETGTGKTSTVQYLAHVAGQRLRIVNMNQQSDTADLLGGYKPVDHKLIWLPLREGFEGLFTQTFSRKQNTAFLGHINTCYKKKRWQDLLKLMQHVLKNAMAKVQAGDSEFLLKEKWEAFSLRLNQAQQQMRMTENAVLFAFVEGTLAQAVKKGEWILLDEINLAAAETLECLCGLLEGSSGSLVLLDRGDTEPLIRHPDFRLFACMNPATDVGKRNLPPGIRNRFTELYVEELENESDLQILITDYLKGLNVNISVVQGIISFYLAIRERSVSELVDGTGHRPHFSLRTLCRALRYAAANPCNNIQRSLYEGFCLSFLTQLDRASHSSVQALVCRCIVPGNIKSLLKQPLPEPYGGRFIQIEGYWIPVGGQDPTIDESYILTSSVKLNLRDLVRVVSAGKHPVLIQGETSVGKTSLIRWLACASGNHCVRINNHEHTDIQEYIGCYTSDASGKLVFQEGILIHAMRNGYWIILDELNLAPTDVLEALNRLLDDNRELFIIETQEVVKAHPRFMLFATQNPPGIYGGRKVLSRAFRNRFVELHYDELPSAELETILHKRCCLPPSYCNKLVAVMLELQSHRRGSSVFAGKHGFITLRDLFRWAERYRLSEQTEKDYDWLQHLANDGFLLLAGRVRKQEEVDVILKVIKKCFKKEVVPEVLFSMDSVQKKLEKLSVLGDAMDHNFSHVVWTQGMRRLAVLVGRALEFGEPILLVGDTGCGKTTICQLFAALQNQKLYSVNCHQHMETSDFLGGLRPVRHKSKDKDEDDDDSSKLFEWHDGPLVLAMVEDGFFLLDEISLADDSVLERLNSVLEVEKTLVLAEKGGKQDDNEVELLTAGPNFRIFATMNPGGDFGKKELSPALRNRFTEIWCPQSNDRLDLIEIIKHNLNPGMTLTLSDDNGAILVADLIIDFIEWLTNQEFGRRCILSIRDILSWVHFMNVTVKNDFSETAYEGTNLDTVTALIHAACLVYIDGLGSGTTFCSSASATSVRQQCMRFLHEKLSAIVDITEEVEFDLQMYEGTIERKINYLESLFGIEPFYIPRGPIFHEDALNEYALNSETTSMNAQRLLRAMQLNKPILLEGSPGVGKTSLVTALAKASGNHLVRINLSEQTDVTDLFGTDLPIEGGKGGEFAWRDGPLLSALKAGHWIVLDELNLASQSVLEGLNACFDHRAEVYVPELGMSFQVQHKKTKIFGCQNPFRQGGGRKGLPRSFLNRFTQVFVDQLSSSDMQFIAFSLFPALGEDIIDKIVAFNNQIDLEVMTERKWGQKGGPWEFNLRDLYRWCNLMLHDQSLGNYDPSQHVFLVYGERMRSKEDRQKLISLYVAVFGEENAPYLGTRHFHISPQNIQVGFSVLPRGPSCSTTKRQQLSLLHHSLQSLEPVMKCVEMGWMVILVGPAAVGKTSLVQLLALLTGNKLNIMAMNSAMDTTELLGGFEQADINRPWQQFLEQVWNAVVTLVRDSLLATDISPDETEILLRSWSNLNLSHKAKSMLDEGHGVSTEVLNKLDALLVQIQKLNGKLNSFSKAEFTAILESLRNFKDQLLHSVEGQTGGTFEWVDGILVQSLRAGDWLLMDNVNFCSSSVLDRLNALLEPGGVLTVSERGVIDGTIPTILPHPNFRLFMTLDPAHGEISRAMRNRGVELYIHEDGDSALDSYDIKTLLNSLGVIGDDLCNALKHVHKEINDTIIGSPCSSLSYLLHAGVLLSQQLQRGIDLEHAFQKACSEVFVYSQPTAVVQRKVQDIIQGQVCLLGPRHDGCLLSIGLWPDKVPDAIFSSEDSTLSTILRDSQVLLYILNRHCLQKSRNNPLAIQDLQLIAKSANAENLSFNALEMEGVWMDDPVVIKHSVQLIIEKSTSLDWILRMRWLSHLSKKIPSELDHVRTEIDAGAQALSRFYSSPLSDELNSVMKLLYSSGLGDNCVPIDPRWNMQLLNTMKHSLSVDTGMEPDMEIFSQLDSVINRAILLVNRQKQSFTEAHISRKPKRLSALKIAVEFHKDPAVHQDLPHPVIAHLAAFFDLWDMLVCEYLESSLSPLTDEVTGKVFSCLRWRDRFRLISENVGLEHDDLALLTLHWNWVAKHAVKQISEIFIGELERLCEEVQCLSLNIQDCLATSSSQSPASIKLLQKVLGRPLPFKEDCVVHCVQKLKALGAPLNVTDLRPVKQDSTWQLEMCKLKAASSAWETKFNLLEAWASVLQANHQEDINADNLFESVEILRSQVKKQGILLGPGDGSQEGTVCAPLNQECLAKLSSRVQMWPGMEYLMLLWQYKMITDVLSHSYYVRKNIQSDLNQLVAFCLEHTPVSVEQLRAFSFLSKQSEINSSDVALLWSELISSVLSSFWNSTVTTDPDYWSSWKVHTCPDDANVPQPLMEPSMKGPGILNRAVLSKCFYEVLTGCSKALSCDMNELPVLLTSRVRLGEGVERLQQLHEISSTLWTNMAISSLANFRNTDSRLQGLLCYHHFVALKDLVPESLQEEFLQYCHHLPQKDASAFYYIQDILRDWSSEERLPENIVKLLLTCLQHFHPDDVDESVEPSEAAHRGPLWINLGILQIHLWLPVTTFDPAVKRKYKLQYAEEELHELELEWKTRNLSCSLLTGQELSDDALQKHNHPHIRSLLQRIQKLKAFIYDLSKKQAYRPTSPTYNTLHQDIHNYLNSIGKMSSIQDFSTRLLKALSGKATKSRQGMLNLLSEEVTWQRSQQQFRKRLSEEYSLYPDIVIPLQAAILQVQHGMRVIASELYVTMNSALISPPKITSIISSLLAFPSTSEAFPTYFSHADSLCSVGSLDILKSLKKLSQKYPCKDQTPQAKDLSCCLTKEQLLVNGLLYLRCHILSKGEMEEKSLKLFRHICQAIINEWDEQEQIAKEQEDQESSLYKYKSKSLGSGVTENEEEEREFRMRFPVYEQDFADLTEQFNLDDVMETQGSDSEVADQSRLLSQSSMHTVMLVHQQLCLSVARSRWYQQKQALHLTRNYLTVFLSCYQTCAALIDSLYPLIEADLNDHLSSSHLLASTLLQNTILGNSASDLVVRHEGPYDFYQHPNIQQVTQCQCVLRRFSEELSKLMGDWPDHPALLQLVVIIDRIQGFSLSSPLSKFLNGLEILLAKSQDWEENASRNLSLRKNLDEVTQLIFQWRKLELNCWSLSLDNAMKRHAEKSYRHWFSIYQLIEDYLQVEQEKENEQEQSFQSVTKTLQAFIEGSTLGEFQARLHMILVFHCHVLLVPQTPRKDSLCSLLWNLYHYYKQFLPSVEARIHELRKPVEKELKDFVKISKWNDVSFWSVKQSVEKTHRTLFKHIKKFEATLNEASSSALVESIHEDQLDFMGTAADLKVKRNAVQQLASLLSSPSSEASSMPLNCGEDIYSAASLQCRLPKLTKRMRQLCNTFIKESSMPSLFENLNTFTEGIIESVQELQNLTVNQAAEKEKQKSEAKHILMQKQRALAELFKMLSKTGLSYRRGIAWMRTKDNKDMLCLRPLDLHSAFVISTHGLENKSELLAEITTTWDGCQKYFYRSLARNARLETALLSPVKELGLGNIERCKGFSGYLLKTLMKQRSSLTNITDQWIVLRNLISCMQEISSRLDSSNEYKIAFPPQDGVQQWVDKLQNLAVQCSVVLEQLSWLLQCCPADSEEGQKKTCEEAKPWTAALNVPSPAAADWLPKLCTIRRSDSDWQELNATVSKMLTEIKSIKTAVDTIRLQSSETLFYSWNNFETCSSALDTMQQIALDLREVELLFVLPETEVKEAAQHMIFLRSFHCIREEIRSAIREFTSWKSRLQAIGRAKRNQESDEKYVKDFSDQVEAAIKCILCGTQKLVEKNKQKEMPKLVKTEEEAEDQKEDSLQEGLITKLLTEDLCHDLKALDVQTVISSVSGLLERLKSYVADCIKDKHAFFNQCCGLLVRLLPMLSSYSDLLLFYLTVSLTTHRATGKLLSVLTHIFTELAQKGFCIPKELIEDSAGEGATQFHDYEGGGIGEGEGMKDVSDKIENEDQVEDTLKKGQEKDKDNPDDKPDVKEEDNAIEMSDDFDGKMHDGDQETQENEDDKSSSEEDDLDKQMGDLGDADADKLDERLWGDDDDENDVDDDDNDKAEETGPGMDMGESELVAKDDNQNGDQGKDEKRNQKEETKEEKGEENRKDKIHEQIDEREYDENETDPYHGKQDTNQEPEALDLPDDLNLETDEGKASGDEKDKENGEEENPCEIEEKSMDIKEEEKGQEENDEEKSDAEVQEMNEGDQENLDKDEQKEEPGPQEAEEESTNNEAGENVADLAEEEEKQEPEKENENGLPTDSGLLPQNEEEEKINEDEEVPDSAQRMEHETCGQTAEDNLQSDTAAELAGAASEKDEAKEEHGTGSADASQSEGHESKLMARMALEKQSVHPTQSVKRKPGQTDDNRTLGDDTEQVHKRLKTMESSSEMDDHDKQTKHQTQEADAYEHIKQGAESFDAQTYDTASKEQEKSIQPRKEEKDESAAQEDVEMEIQEDECLESVSVEELKPEQSKSKESIAQGPMESDPEVQSVSNEDEIPIRDSEATNTDMAKPDRSMESSIHTDWDLLREEPVQSAQNLEDLRKELEKQLEAWYAHGDAEEEKSAAEMWQSYLLLTAPLSQQLCEQLRLILEPTKAAKLKGDYRTGKRLNMRKVIPYIASQFRKDKIWLRRTKPSKREYQICLAIDDSSSMVDNHSKQLAYESLAVIGNALTLLEVGQIAVYSFGENVKLLHPFHEQFSEQSGSRILSQCKFQQKKTLLAQFLESCVPMFAAAQQMLQVGNPETAQLLIIVSDGRGLFVEGKDRVTSAVKAARNANIFIIFIILDSPTSKDSILNIKVPIFTDPKEMPKMISYMEQFPFPFYIILRDVNTLPETLSDALRQWFELVTTSEHV